MSNKLQVKPQEAQPKQVRLLDPQKEEKRTWLAKREGLDANRTRTVEVLFCRFCNGPIGPDQLLIDKGGERACTSCATK
jgi:hypothetical protein